MKVLHALAGAEHGGAETFATELIIALARRGVEQLVLTRPYADRVKRLAAHDVACRAFDFDPARTVLLGRRLIRKLMAGGSFDLLQSWMGRGASAVPALRAPALGWMGGYYDPKRYRHCDHIVTCTADIRDFVLQKGWAPSRVHYINTFALLEESPPLSRADFGLPADATVFRRAVAVRAEPGLVDRSVLRRAAELTNEIADAINR